YVILFFFSSRRRHTSSLRDWSSDVCSSDLKADVMKKLGLLIAALILVGLGYLAGARRGAPPQAGDSGPARGKTERKVAFYRSPKIGRASCRERVEVSGVAGEVKVNKGGSDL